jgi:hypothetical protein
MADVIPVHGEVHRHPADGFHSASMCSALTTRSSVFSTGALLCFRSLWDGSVGVDAIAARWPGQQFGF